MAPGKCVREGQSGRCVHTSDLQHDSIPRRLWEGHSGVSRVSMKVWDEPMASVAPMRSGALRALTPALQQQLQGLHPGLLGR